LTVASTQVPPGMRLQSALVRQGPYWQVRGQPPVQKPLGLAVQAASEVHSSKRQVLPGSGAGPPQYSKLKGMECPLGWLLQPLSLRQQPGGLPGSGQASSAGRVRT